MDLSWRKSSRSNANGSACVEIAVVERGECGAVSRERRAADRSDRPAY